MEYATTWHAKPHKIALMPSYLQSLLPCYSFSFICLLHENGQDLPSFICSYMLPFHGRDLPWVDQQAWISSSARDGIVAFDVLRPFLPPGTSRNRLNGRVHSPERALCCPKTSCHHLQDMSCMWEFKSWVCLEKRKGSLMSFSLQ